MGVTYEEMQKGEEESKHQRPDLVPGALVEREIEGMWFPAEITASFQRGRMFTLTYIDDGNVEEGVSIEEIRICRNTSSILGSPRGAKKSSLPKPLLGLVDDDWEIRNSHEAKVTIHQDCDTETSIIINGAEKALAAGGGLRALRHLKNMKK